MQIELFLQKAYVFTMFFIFLQVSIQLTIQAPNLICWNYCKI